MREEFGGRVGMSVLPLWLVLQRIQVLLEFVFEISLVINFRFKFTLSILFNCLRLFLSALLLQLEGVEY